MQLADVINGFYFGLIGHSFVTQARRLCFGVAVIRYMWDTTLGEV